MNPRNECAQRIAIEGPIEFTTTDGLDQDGNPNPIAMGQVFRVCNVDLAEMGPQDFREEAFSLLA